MWNSGRPPWITMTVDLISGSIVIDCQRVDTSTLGSYVVTYNVTDSMR